MCIIFGINDKIKDVSILIQGGKGMLSKNIKRLRQINQYSQEKLAEKQVYQGKLLQNGRTSCTRQEK